MKTQQQIREYIAQHPQLSDHSIAKNLARHGVTVPEIRAARNGTAAVEKASGRSIASLIDQFDDVKKVKQAMKALPKDQFVEDEEMRHQVGTSSDRWRLVAQHAALEVYRFLLPTKKRVWMHPEAQEKLTAAINLSQS
jgi:hypothetical protein